MIQTVLSAILAAGVVGGGVVWLIRAVVARDVKPLGEAVIRAEGAIDRLTEAMTTAEHAAREHRGDIREAVDAIKTMLADHEVRISRAELKLEVRP